MNEWRRSGSGKCALTDLVWVLAAAAGADKFLPFNGWFGNVCS